MRALTSLEIVNASRLCTSFRGTVCSNYSFFFFFLCFVLCLPSAALVSWSIGPFLQSLNSPSSMYDSANIWRVDWFEPDFVMFSEAADSNEALVAGSLATAPVIYTAAWKIEPASLQTSSLLDASNFRSLDNRQLQTAEMSRRRFCEFVTRRATTDSFLTSYSLFLSFPRHDSIPWYEQLPKHNQSPS